MIEIDTMIRQMEEVETLLWQGESTAYVELKKYIDDWEKKIMIIMEELVKKYQQDSQVMGIILQQIENLGIAIQRKDDCMLADTLGSELLNTLYYYKELVSARGQ